MLHLLFVFTFVFGVIQLITTTKLFDTQLTLIDGNKLTKNINSLILIASLLYQVHWWSKFIMII